MYRTQEWCNIPARFPAHSVGVRFQIRDRNRGWTELTSALLLIIAGIFAAPSPIDAGQLSLVQALELMQRNNPELSAVRHELIVAKGELQRASYLSQFNFQVASEGNYRAQKHASPEIRRTGASGSSRNSKFSDSARYVKNRRG